MNPNLYVIKGKPNSGKTTTCWKLLEKLKSLVVCYNYWELISFNHKITDLKKKFYYIEKRNGNKDAIDFIFVAHLDQTNPNNKVAIISAGDDPFYVKRAIHKVLGENAHFIVCCEHPKGATHRILHSEFDIKHEYSLEQMKDDKEEDNVAQQIYEQIINDMKLKK